MKKAACYCASRSEFLQRRTGLGPLFVDSAQFGEACLSAIVYFIYSMAIIGCSNASGSAANYFA